jgi:hypothetical protein
MVFTALPVESVRVKVMGLQQQQQAAAAAAAAAGEASVKRLRETGTAVLVSVPPLSQQTIMTQQA